MFWNKSKSREVKSLEAKLALAEHENKLLTAKNQELEKRIALMKRAMEVVNNAKKGVK